LAMAALSDRLEINYQGQIADFTRIGTSGNTKIEVIGPNSSSTADNQIYHTATYHTFNHTSDLASPVAGEPANRVMTINSANGTMNLNNSTPTKINNAGDKAVVTKEYLTGDRGGSHYRPGEVVETFSGICGRHDSNGNLPTRTVLSGTYTMPSLGNTSTSETPFQLQDNLGNMFGLITYKRLPGVKFITYRFDYIGTYYNSNPIMGLLNFNEGFRPERATHASLHYTIECVDNLADQDLSIGKVYWPENSSFRIGGMFKNEHSTDNKARLFGTRYRDNSDGSNGTDPSMFNPPNLTITSIAG
jgi:hypothetical protein